MNCSTGIYVAEVKALRVLSSAVTANLICAFDFAYVKKQIIFSLRGSIVNCPIALDNYG